MRVIVQRVEKAHVTINKEIVGSIGQGYLLYIGIHVNDTPEMVQKMAEKIHLLRIFEDEQGKMNLNVSAVQGSILAISQFTLYGNTKGNNRPSFIEAQRPELAEPLYESLCKTLSIHHHVEKGVFGADMKVHAINDGPVTILIEF